MFHEVREPALREAAAAAGDRRCLAAEDRDPPGSRRGHPRQGANGQRLRGKHRRCESPKKREMLRKSKGNHYICRLISRAIAPSDTISKHVALYLLLLAHVCSAALLSTWFESSRLSNARWTPRRRTLATSTTPFRGASSSTLRSPQP